MKIDTARQLHPVLVADLAHEKQLVQLHQIAGRRGAVVVPLLAAPVDRRTHILEVYVPGAGAPVIFLADPIGAPTDRGYPLRLQEYEPGTSAESADAGENRASSEPPTLVTVARGEKNPTSPTLSARHTRDLENPTFSPPAPDGGVDPYLGRELAGGKYRLDALVGRGGMGAVYRGRHRDLDKEVAIKVLHSTFQTEEFSQRFHVEALTMSKIDHPNVTRILDFGQEPDGLLYLAMEFLDGVDLQAVLDQEGALPLERAVRIIGGVCAGLGHVHRHGIIHRDIKPTNILLVAGLDDDDTPTEIPKVCDFGVALAWSGPSEGSHVAGTPEYMSPEQCRGMALDARSDVYACGMLMYELATGKLPFTGDDGAEVARRQVLEAPAPPSVHMPDIDPLYESTIMKAISKDPAQRQQSMRHLRAELRELLAPIAVSVENGPESLRGHSDAAPPMPGASQAADGGQAEERESWLEVQSEGMSSFLFEHQNFYNETQDLSETLARDPVGWLADLGATEDATKFAESVKLLEPVVHKLMKKADATTLSAIVQALRAIIKADGASGARATSAGAILRLLRDPARLAPLVEKALGRTEEPSREMQHVLVEPQLAAAQALLEGRLAHASPAARARFITMMRAIGPAALAPLTVTLRGFVSRGELDGPMVEDLLRSIPPGPSDATGSVVAEFLKSSSADTLGAALVALAGLWGERARALLFGALGHSAPAVVEAAITGLRVLRAIDAHVLGRLEPIVTGAVATSEEARVAAAVALGEAQPDARAAAGRVAAKAFAPPPKPTRLWTTAPPSAGPELIVTLARSLLALGVPNAPALIQQRASESPEALRRALAALVPWRV